MQRQSVSPVQRRDWVDVALGAVVGELTDPITVHLFTAGPGTITPDTVVGDFTEASFTDYAAVDVAASAILFPRISQNSNAEVAAIVAVFSSGLVGSPGQTVLGYYVTDSTDTELYFSEEFDEPVLFIGPAQILTVLAELPLFMVGSLS